MKTFIFFIVLLFTTELPVEKPNSCVALDIMLIADMSTSVSGYEPFIHSALSAFTKRFELSDDGIKLGLIRFSSGAYQLSELTSNKTKIENGIETIADNAEGNTNMSEAIMLAGDEILKNGRIGVGKIVVIISDGEPDSTEDALHAASLLKAINVTICGIFINAGYHEPFMRSISSEYCYVESNYNNLVSEIEKLNICL